MGDYIKDAIIVIIVILFLVIEVVACIMAFPIYIVWAVFNNRSFTTFFNAYLEWIEKTIDRIMIN